MQTFLALDLPQEVKTQLSDQLEELRRDYPYLDWVEKDLYHVTLFQFGETYTTEHLVESIDRALYDVSPFHMFGIRLNININRNITFYVSFAERKPLKQAVVQIKDALEIHNDLKFTPDLLVAQYKIPSKQQYLLMKKKCSKYVIDIEFPITQITLLNSVIESKRVRYDSVHQFNLE
jgi:2'-5' RNA ligase